MYARPASTARLPVCRVFDRFNLSPAVGLAGRDSEPKARAERARAPGGWHRLATRFYTLCTVQAASMVLAAGALAQSNACDQLKAVLAARIDASGVRGYSLDVVPGSAPVPPGAKAIGTCEAGASKVLYRRWGAAKASSGAAGAVAPATAAQAIALPDEPARGAPGVQGGRRSRPLPASAASPTPPPVSRSHEAVVAALTPAPAKFPTDRSSEVEASRAVDRAVLPPASLIADTSAEVKAPLARQASEFMATDWRWIGALVLLATVALIWVWRSRFSAYDKAGLPRGPRL